MVRMLTVVNTMQKWEVPTRKWCYYGARKQNIWSYQNDYEFRFCQRLSIVSVFSWFTVHDLWKKIYHFRVSYNYMFNGIFICHNSKSKVVVSIFVTLNYEWVKNLWNSTGWQWSLSRTWWQYLSLPSKK